MEHPAERGRKKKAGDNGEQPEMLGSNATSAIAAGTWMTPKKRARTALKVCTMNHERGSRPLLITATDLERTLGANALMLVGDGEGFRVLNMP
jgi:hypothetical protein